MRGMKQVSKPRWILDGQLSTSCIFLGIAVVGVFVAVHWKLVHLLISGVLVPWLPVGVGGSELLPMSMSILWLLLIFVRSSRC